VYASVYASDYAIFEATEDMLLANASSHDMEISTLNDSTPSNVWGTTIDTIASVMYSSAVAGNLTRLDVADCITAYATNFQTAWGNVILVTSDGQNLPWAWIYDNQQEVTDFDSGYTCGPRPYDWVCGPYLYPPENSLTACQSPTRPACPQHLANVSRSDWKPFRNKIDYCLAEKLNQRCTVEFSIDLAMVVIVFNFAKAVVHLYTFLYVRENPLMTIGDAIASFLSQEDWTTRDLCLMSKADINLWGKIKGNGLQAREPARFRHNRQRWFRVISGARWCTLLTLSVSLAP